MFSMFFLSFCYLEFASYLLLSANHVSYSHMICQTTLYPPIYTCLNDNSTTPTPTLFLSCQWSLSAFFTPLPTIDMAMFPNSEGWLRPEEERSLREIWKKARNNGDDFHIACSTQQGEQTTCAHSSSRRWNSNSAIFLNGFVSVALHYEPSQPLKYCGYTGHQPYEC